MTTVNLHPGQLKIFLGYAPGCGKTHAMLDAAQRRLSEGGRVVIGCLDSTVPDEQVGLPVEPFLKIGQTIQKDLDVDRVISQNPTLVVVDNLAAVNLPGSRHPRRFQDVQEILSRGMDVFTTLDINQLESLRDAPWQYSGSRDLATLPDRVFDEASVIEFVDVSPDELLHRLAQMPQIRSQYADPTEFDDYFSLERLTLMRETALRRVAGRIHTEYESTQTRQGNPPALPIQNKILVCISSHPLAERLIRAGRRMADELSAPWVALYIETPDRIGFSYPHSEQLEKNLALASELGAEIAKVPGHGIASAVLDYARSHQVTRIILGHPQRTWWQELFTTSLVDRIIRQSGMMDVYVISDERGVTVPGIFTSLQARNRWPAYLNSILLVLVATGIGYLMHLWIDPANLVMIYLVVVVISAVNWGRGPSMLASVVSALAFDFFLIEPKLSLTVDDTQYLISLVGLMVVSLVVSNLASTIQAQVNESRLREARSNALYNLSRGLASALDMGQIYSRILDQLRLTFECEAALWVGEAFTSSTGFENEEDCQTVVSWVREQGQPAGLGTQTYPAGKTHYRPLITGQHVLGVVGIQFRLGDRLFSTEKRQVLEAYTAMAALAIERAQLAEQANQTRLTQEKEKLQTTLLNSISHDLRTPLATITGVLSTLHETEGDRYDRMDRQLRAELIDTGWEEAERLNRLVGNLLDITRLEAGAVHLKLVEVDLVEVIGSVRNRMKDRLDNFDMVIDLADDLPSVFVDVTLIEQVMVNLLDNAIKFSQPGGKITISGRLVNSRMLVTVADQGEGIPPAEIDHIFDKFFRGKSHERMSGTGLGLAICKGLVEIHGGAISARNLPGGGVALSFDLPISPLSDSPEAEA